MGRFFVDPDELEAPEKMHPGALLRSLRELSGMSQTDLASRLPDNVHQGVVSRTERQADMHVSTFVDFLAALGHQIKVIPATYPRVTSDGSSE